MVTIVLNIILCTLHAGISSNHFFFFPFNLIIKLILWFNCQTSASLADVHDIKLTKISSSLLKLSSNSYFFNYNYYLPFKLFIILKYNLSPTYSSTFALVPPLQLEPPSPPIAHFAPQPSLPHSPSSSTIINISPIY